MLVGSNAAWCHPVLFQRMQAARQKRGAKLVVIDPRGSATAEEADCHLAAPARATDARSLRGSAGAPGRHGRDRPAFVGDHTCGFDEALAAPAPSRRTSPRSPHATGLTRRGWWRFYALLGRYAARGHPVLAGRQPVRRRARTRSTPSSTATSPRAASVARAWGRSRSPASPTPWAAARSAGSPTSSRPIWAFRRRRSTASAASGARRPWRRGEGLKAVDMFEAIERGEIKALWVMGTNPAVSLPRADAMRAAMRRLDLLVVSENVASTDTVGSGAHVLLPAAAWGEKDGTVTNSERRISRQRRLPARSGRGEARLVDRGASRRTARPRGSVRLFRPGRYLSRTRRAVDLRKRQQPRLLARRSCRHERVGVRADEADPMAELSPTEAPANVSLPKGGSSRPMDAPASSPSPRCPQRGRRRGFPFC